MRPKSTSMSLAGLAIGIAVLVGACSSAAATPSSNVAGATAMASATEAMAAMTSPPATTGITIGSTNDPTLGAYLTGPTGFTLYIRTSDTPDTSSCTGSCTTNWPPLTLASGATITGPAGSTLPFAAITRPDGIVQVTYNHMPLYYYAGDSKAGDTTGEGLLGVWFVAPLSGTQPAAAPSAAAATPTATAASGY